ncbi:MAG: PAS domain-containing protein, partial [Hylemonella sp.]
IGSWNWDIAGGSLHWSDEIYRIFGLTPQSFGATYEAFLNAIHPDDRQGVTDAVNASLADPNLPYTVRHRVLRPDGEIRTVQENGAIYRDAAGQPVRMIGTVQDVTEDVRRDAALRESEQKHRRLYESMTDAFVQTDMQGRLVDWNPAYQAMLGYTKDELARKNYVELTPERWHAMEADIVANQILPLGHSEIYQKEYLGKGGTVFPVELRAPTCCATTQARPSGCGPSCATSASARPPRRTSPAWPTTTP